MHVFLILIGCWVSGTHCGTPSSKRARTAALLNARGDGRCFFDGILRHYVLATLYRWFAEARLAADEPHAQKQQSNRDLKHDEVIEIFRLSSFVETRLQSIYLFDMTAKHRYRSSQTTGLQFHTDMATPHMDLTDVYAASWERIITSFWLLKMCSCQSRFCQLQPTSRSLPPVRCQVVLGWDWHPCRNHHRIVPPQQANAKHTGMSTYNKFTCWWLTSKLQTCASFFHVPNSDEDQINWARKLLFFSIPWAKHSSQPASFFRVLLTGIESKSCCCIHFPSLRCRGGEWSGDRGRFFLFFGAGGGGMSPRGGTTVGVDGAHLGFGGWLAAGVEVPAPIGGGWLAAGLGPIAGSIGGPKCPIGGVVGIAALAWMAPASAFCKAMAPIWSHNQCNLQSIWNRPSSILCRLANFSGGKFTTSVSMEFLGTHFGRPTHAPDTGNTK